MGEIYMWSTPQVYHAPIHYNTASFSDAFYAFQMPHYNAVYQFSSGILIFEDALEKIVGGKRVQEGFPPIFRSATNDSAVVTTRLHYIDPSTQLRNGGAFRSMREVLDNSSIKIVPLSVGCNWVRKFYPSMEVSGFPIEPEMVRFLQDVAERVDSIGCREEYSARS